MRTCQNKLSANCCLIDFGYFTVYISVSTCKWVKNLLNIHVYKLSKP